MPKSGAQRCQSDLGEVDVLQARSAVGAAAVADAAYYLVTMDDHEAARKRCQHGIVPIMWALMAERLVLLPPGHQTQRVPLEDSRGVRFAVRRFHIPPRQPVHPCTRQQISKFVDNNQRDLAVPCLAGLT